MKHKIYVFCNGGAPGWYAATAIGDDGQGCGGHICSHPAYIPHDMGITSDWKHDIYNRTYGEGNWELELVPEEQVKARSHAGLEEAYRLNQLIHEKVKNGQTVELPGSEPPKEVS